MSKRRHYQDGTDDVESRLPHDPANPRKGIRNAEALSKATSRAFGLNTFSAPEDFGQRTRDGVPQGYHRGTCRIGGRDSR